MAATDDSPRESVSPALDAMVCDLIGDMLDALAEGSDPGVVLCAEDAAANRYEAAFIEDDPSVCLDGARHFVELNESGLPSDHVGPLERYAIACTGGIEEGGAFRDAVLVSFYERSLTCGYSAYVLYTGAGSGDAFMWSDPEPAGEEPPLLEPHIQ